MKINRYVSTLLCVAALVFGGMSAGFAEEKKAMAEGQTCDFNDPEMQKLMMAYATPSEGHKQLEGMVGTWEAEAKMWSSPDAPPSVSTGVSENSWVLGGRFIKQVYKGEFEGMTFEGLGFTGYDNHQKKFIGIWMDSMSTGWMTSIGTSDESGRNFEYTAEMETPWAGKVTYREEIRVVNENTHVMAMYSTGPDGKEMKNMEITYKRR